MKTIIINDLHLGVNRSGGTTLSSLDALREYGHTKHRDLLAQADDGDTTIVNGDLSDVYDIPLAQAIEIYITVVEHLQAKQKSRVIWAVGNHDLSKDSSKLGTVAFLGALLQGQFPGRFQLLDRAGLLGADIYIIPHVANQEMFDMELTRIPTGVKFLLLHCNFDNEFAGAMDHSLNLSRKQAKALRDRGITMILGHEHQQRDLLGGRVVIVGNQFPTSVADCLGNDTKRCAVIEDGELSFIQTWSRDDKVGYFQEVDWRDVAGFIHEPSGFIRVAGNAKGEEAAEMIKAISTLRSKSEAFVITNAVQVEQAEGLGDIAASVEDVRSVNVIDLLLEVLDPEQQRVVKQLVGRDVEPQAAEAEEEEEVAA
ncbi:Calcineurin-like phosphoesterase [Variovorax sp. PBS-H4]|uniref:metallophosphoesterase family protein n=1 Tax=Variovorax sp. PBS-H4 TaxID=434008 RepID=UPI001319B35E|nr:metallophosphoesterase [Variovorax sp. PBS-H4]VTU31823.1 Calcineurin-like phosphoesterase [Variovorax sp. PBS-H4]